MTRSLTTVTCVAVLVLAACSSSTEPADPPLTALDARRAASAFASLGQGGDLGGDIGPEAGSTTTFSCPDGGSVRTSVTNTGITNIRATLVFASCAVADSTGALWTFTSVPKLDVTITPTFSDSLLMTVSTTRGTLRVESSTVRGACPINTRVQTEIRPSTPPVLRVRQSGQVCGQAVDTTFTETF